MSHIQLNYAFLVFWIIYAQIDWKLPIWWKKRDYQKETKKYTESTFLNNFEKGLILRNGFDLMETTFLGQTSEVGQIISKEDFPPQNELHTAKLSFSYVL